MFYRTASAHQRLGGTSRGAPTAITTILATLALALIVSACGGAAARPNEAQDPASVFARFNSAVTDGDAELAAAQLADGVVLFGTEYGAAELLAAARSLPCTTEIISSSTEGDRLTVTVELTGPSPIAGEGVVCDVGMQGTVIVTVEDGKITAIEPAQ